MWSTSINDGCLQVWSHDEFLLQDSYAKEAEQHCTDLLTSNPEGDLAEHLQDSCEKLSERCALYEQELASVRSHTTVLEDEIQEQNACIARQSFAHQKLTDALADYKAKVPGIERELHNREVSLDQSVTDSRLTLELVSKLRSENDAKDLKIKELERKLTALTDEKRSVEGSYEKLKDSNVRMVVSDIDEVMKKAEKREEDLRSQAETLRAQLVQALNNNRKKLPRPQDTEEYLQQEAGRYAFHPHFSKINASLASVNNKRATKIVKDHLNWLS